MTGRSGVRVIAIDGPGGAGKSTVAAGVARRLGLAWLDTGAMYRAVTVAALRRGVPLDDGERLGALANGVGIEVEGGTVTLDGENVTKACRAGEVDAHVSELSAHPEVRRVLVERQRAWATAHGGGVVEGRDIGTVVFPEAALKIFLVADEAERARRRAAERSGLDADSARAALQERDRTDSGRAASPLTAAEDATAIDTTMRSVDEVVRMIVELAS